MTDRRFDTDDRRTDSNEHETRTVDSDRSEITGRSAARDRSDGPTRRSLISATAIGIATAVSGCLTNPWGPEEPAEESDQRGSDDAGGSEESSTDGNGTAGDESGSETDDGVDPLDREPAQIVEVAPDGFLFEPGSFEIDAGETVHWVWEDSGHNVRVRSKPDGSDWEGTPGTGSDTYGEGYEHGYTFETPGEYVYFCAPHQSLGLEGSFTVR